MCVGVKLFIYRNSLDLAADPAGEHVSDHFEIGNERPERILKCRGPVLFNNKVREPGECVPDNKKDGEEIPFPAGNEKDQQADA